MARTSRSTGGTARQRRPASWLRWRYHYPQAEFPYALLRQENAKRNKDEPEFELIDTGIFEDRPLLADHGGLRQSLTRGYMHAHQRT